MGNLKNKIRSWFSKPKEIIDHQSEFFKERKIKIDIYNKSVGILNHMKHDKKYISVIREFSKAHHKKEYIYSKKLNKKFLIHSRGEVMKLVDHGKWVSMTHKIDTLLSHKNDHHHIFRVMWVTPCDSILNGGGRIVGNVPVNLIDLLDDDWIIESQYKKEFREKRLKQLLENK